MKKISILIVFFFLTTISVFANNIDTVDIQIIMNT